MVAETNWVTKHKKGFAKSVHSPHISLFQPFFVFSFPSFTIKFQINQGLYFLSLFVATNFCYSITLKWEH